MNLCVIITTNLTHLRYFIFDSFLLSTVISLGRTSEFRFLQQGKGEDRSWLDL